MEASEPFVPFLPFTPAPAASDSSLSSSSQSQSSHSSPFNTYTVPSSESSSQHPRDYSGSGSSTENGVCFDWITVHGYTIMDPVLIPLCMWALYIGISRFIKFRKQSNTYFYSITFLTYGIMMTFAMMSDSLSANSNSFWSIAVNYMDVDLTSTVATLFFYCGLADIGKLDMKSIGARLLVCGSSLLIASLWFYSFAITRNDSIWPRILYQGVVGVSCGFYLVFQLYYLSKKLGSFRPIVWLFIAGVTGGIGLVITFESPLWCHYFGSHFNPSYIWFLLSDITMLLISRYIKKSRPQPIVNQLISYYEEDDEHDDPTKTLLSINDIDGGSGGTSRFADLHSQFKYNTFKDDDKDNLKNNNNNNNNNNNQYNYRFMNTAPAPQPYVTVQPQTPLPPIGYVFVSNQNPTRQYFIPTINNNNNNYNL
ncbi:hypothetical protein CYY_007581 [Polysphondylium violaceum]|uniref:Transmembrane protein n=1 Tax=Polysphondylium violaceum TaxID=133409 RepID=A0A8J4PNC1_9MYCE|nr:hypothetical protein CYY_007581 [Polysphondylium violaceum]